MSKNKKTCVAGQFLRKAFLEEGIDIPRHLETSHTEIEMYFWESDKAQIIIGLMRLVTEISSAPGVKLQ